MKPILLALLCVALAGSAPGQGGARHPLDQESSTTSASAVPPIDFSRVWIDEPGDGRTWVRARAYKASFDAEAATYIPFLGSDAPRNFPVRATLEQATAGGVVLPLAAGSVSHTENRVTIDRGAIREVWNLLPDSAEQTFVLAQRPASQGDVRLSVAIESELVLRADGDGFALDGGFGGVRIGRATAIDADGRKLDLAGRIEGSALRFDVPSAFVAAARYPLVVDPIFSTHILEGFGYRTALPDIAGGGSSGHFAVSYDVVFSNNDVDIFSQDMFFGQPIPGTGDWIDISNVSWFDPHIAYNGQMDTYLTTATVQPASGLAEIWCRARRAQTINEFPQRLVQNNAGGDVQFNDVGGDPTVVSPSYFLAVWNRLHSAADFDIHAQLLDPFGVRIGGVIYIENSGELDSFPRVSKSVGVNSRNHQDWNVTWERNLGGAFDVWGAQIHWDGSVTTPAFGISQSALFDDSQAAPSTSLDGWNTPGIWMVAYMRSSANNDIWVRMMSGSTTLAQVNLSSIASDPPGVSQFSPRVDSNGARFAITYVESVSAPGGPQSDAYIATLAWAEGGIRVDEARQVLENGPASTYWVEVAGGHNAQNPGYGLYGAAWSPYINQQSQAYCATYYEPLTYDSFCSGDGSYGSCPCGNVGAPGAGCASSVTSGAVLTPSGRSSVSSDTLTLEATSLPASAPCLFFQGASDSAMGSAFGDGLRCAGGTVVRIASKTASAGVASYPEAGDVAISVKGSIPAGGAQRRYQVWYRNAAAFCTPASFNTTNGVRVRWLL